MDDHNDFILTLTGITPSSWKSIEAQREEEMLLAHEDRPEAVTYSDPIPTVFTCLEMWPIETNLLCFNCGLKFNGPPKSFPISRRETTAGLIEFNVRGNMCSFPCVRSWIDISCRDSAERHEALRNLSLFYFMFTGRQKSDIPPAPDRTLLKSYGGPLSEDAYKQKINAFDKVDRDSDEPTPVADRAAVIFKILHGCDIVERRIVKQNTPITSTPTRTVIDVSENSIWAMLSSTPAPVVEEEQVKPKRATKKTATAEEATTAGGCPPKSAINGECPPKSAINGECPPIKPVKKSRGAPRKN
jgi:hypothetical protein